MPEMTTPAITDPSLVATDDGGQIYEPAHVTKARDCGGHFIVTKPLAPIVVLERIIWIAKGGRAFLLSDNYVGPDRRFGRNPPADHPRRRHDDEPVVSKETTEEVAVDAPGDLPFIDRPLQAAS